jgi:hypothetical protein
MPRVSRPLTIVAGALLLVPAGAAAQPMAPDSDAPVSAAAQAAPLERRWRTDWFRDRDYFNPLVAEPRAPQIAFTFPAWTPAFQYSVEPGTRLVWEVSLGREIPIFARANFDDATQVMKGSQGFGLWVDVSFHMIEDMGKDPSNPIVNTDYRFSLGKLKYYRVVSVTAPSAGDPVRRWKSVAVRWDLYHHESTHLGDEFVINGQGAHPDFERQNVSFEFYDVAGAFNWESGEGLLHSIRGGTTGLVKPSHGYYSDHTLMFPIDTQRDVAKSERNFEPYVQYEFHAPHRTKLAADPFASGSGATAVGAPGVAPGGGAFERPVRWAPFASVDLRRRIVLDFNKPSADVEEDTQWSLNLLAGIRSQAGNFRFSIKEIYARVYRGVNPHGQLRNEKDFWLVGAGINFAVGDR